MMTDYETRLAKALEDIWKLAASAVRADATGVACYVNLRDTLAEIKSAAEDALNPVSLADDAA